MNLEQITQLVASHALGIVQAQQIARALGLDPSAIPVPCEAPGCTNTIPLGDMHSFLSTYATTGPAHISAFGCPDQQHYGCTQEHAMLAFALCVRDHLLPMHAAAVAQIEAPAPALPAPAEGEGAAL